MILEATSGYDFNEEDVKFLNLLASKAEGNKLVHIADLDGLKKQMQEQGIPTDNLEEPCRKMQDNGIIEYRCGMGRNSIVLNSDQAITFQAHLKKISCPKCHKRPLRKKIVTYCPDCDYESDEH